jgi:hypothetical protein
MSRRRRSSSQLIRVVLLGSFAVAAGGCASTYTNIERTGPNTYIVTRVDQGFFSVKGKLFHCEAVAEDHLQCHEIGNP